MNETGITHELEPWRAVIYLLFASGILGQIGVLIVRRWAGQVVPDYSDWRPQHILAEQRWRLGLGPLLAAAWASVAIAFIREALQPGIAPLLASHVGPLPIPQWLALVFQTGHEHGLMFVLWATAVWLDRLVSKKWSRNVWPKGRSVAGFAMWLAFWALALSLLS